MEPHLYTQLPNTITLKFVKLINDNVDNKNCELLFNGQTPLHIAAHNGHISICELMIGILQKIMDPPLFTQLPRLVTLIFTS